MPLAGVNDSNLGVDDDCPCPHIFGRSTGSEGRTSEDRLYSLTSCPLARSRGFRCISLGAGQNKQRRGRDPAALRTRFVSLSRTARHINVLFFESTLLTFFDERAKASTTFFQISHFPQRNTAVHLDALCSVGTKRNTVHTNHTIVTAVVSTAAEACVEIKYQAPSVRNRVSLALYTDGPQTRLISPACFSHQPSGAPSTPSPQNPVCLFRSLS